MTSIFGFSQVPLKIFACDRVTTGRPIRRLHSLLFLSVLRFGDSYIIMPRIVIDDTYLEKLVNLVEEHPVLCDTSLKEYNDSIRNENI